MNRIYHPATTFLLLVSLVLTWTQGQAAETAGTEFRKLTAEELNQEWIDRLGKTHFQPLEMPQVIQPGGNYHDRIFRFAEPKLIRLGEGSNQTEGTLHIGNRKFSYSVGTYPFQRDSAISYFQIAEGAEFDAFVKNTYPGLEAQARTESGTWDLLEIGTSMDLLGTKNAFFLDWQNLGSLNRIISSVLVRLATQQGEDRLLTLEEGKLNSIPTSALLKGKGSQTALVTGLYDPAGLAHLGGSGRFPWWMLAVAFGGGILVLLPFLLWTARRKRAQALGQGEEIEVLEEDPRFLHLEMNLNQAQQPKDLLKVLSLHFPDSKNISAVLAQTKIQLDKAAKTTQEKDHNSKPALESPEQGGKDHSAKEQVDAEVTPSKPSIKIKSESLKSAESASAKSPEGNDSPEADAASDAENRPAPQPEKEIVEVIKEVEVVREVEVVKEVVKEVVVKEKADREQLMKRLANQESPEEKLMAAVAYWDAEFEMEGHIQRDLKQVLRGHRVWKQVRQGFREDKIREALNALALSFGEGNTSKVRSVMDRAEAVQEFVTQVETDRLSPGAGEDSEQGRTSDHLSEVLRGLTCLQKIAATNLNQGSRADYPKAAESLLLGFLYDATAHDVIAGNSFEELKSRLDHRLSWFSGDERFAHLGISKEALHRIDKLVHNFAGQEGGNKYYEAYLKKYGNVIEKLNNYQDPPTLDELREWWSQVFEMVFHAYDYFRFNQESKENSHARLNIMMVENDLKLHQLPDGDIRPFSEKVEDVPRSVRNAREMARSIGISRLDKVVVEGYYIHPRALKPLE